MASKNGGAGGGSGSSSDTSPTLVDSDFDTAQLTSSTELSSDNFDTSVFETPYDENSPIGFFPKDGEAPIIMTRDVSVTLDGMDMSVRLVEAKGRRRSIEFNDAQQLVVNASYGTKGKDILKVILDNKDFIKANYGRLKDIHNPDGSVPQGLEILGVEFSPEELRNWEVTF